MKGKDHLKELGGYGLDLAEGGTSGGFMWPWCEPRGSRSKEFLCSIELDVFVIIFQASEIYS